MVNVTKSFEEQTVESLSKIIGESLKREENSNTLARMYETIMSAVLESVDTTIAEAESPSYRQFINELTMEYIATNKEAAKEAKEIIETEWWGI